MHPHPEAFRLLHKRWADEAMRRRFAPTDAVQHYLAAVRPRTASKRHLRWAEACQRLEAHVAAYGTLPTLRSTEHLPGAKEMIQWIRYQRRNADRLSNYQRARLELLPGFSWSPGDEAWLSALQNHEFFVRENCRLPSRRSADDEEARLAIWFRNNRSLARKGRLSPDRLGMLLELQRRVTALVPRR